MGAIIGVVSLILTAASVTTGQVRPAQADLWAPGDDHVNVSAWQGEVEYRAFLRSDPALQLLELRRSAGCLYGPAVSRPCPQHRPELPPLSLVCEDGPPVAPLWRRDRESITQEFRDDWYLYADWSCPEDLFPPFTQADLRRLAIEPLQVNQQPAAGPTLIRKPTIVYAQPAQQQFRTVLFDDFGVEIVVMPSSYTWDFGDGETVTTAEPGRPYPAFDVTHTYLELGTYRISLTTAWSGRYRFDTDVPGRWRDVEGTAHTVDDGDEFDVIELRGHLDG